MCVGKLYDPVRPFVYLLGWINFLVKYLFELNVGGFTFSFTPSLLTYWFCFFCFRNLYIFWDWLSIFRDWLGKNQKKKKWMHQCFGFRVSSFFSFLFFFSINNKLFLKNIFINFQLQKLKKIKTTSFFEVSLRD